MEAVGVDRVRVQLSVLDRVCSAVLGNVQAVPEHNENCRVHPCAC